MTNSRKHRKGTSGERAPGTHLIGGRVGLRAGLNAVEEGNFSWPFRESDPGRSARSLSLYRLSCPRPVLNTHLPLDAVHITCSDSDIFTNLQRFTSLIMHLFPSIFCSSYFIIDDITTQIISGKDQNSNVPHYVFSPFYTYFIFLKSTLLETKRKPLKDWIQDFLIIHRFLLLGAEVGSKWVPWYCGLRRPYRSRSWR
jgi:hypothetical protein